MHAFPSTRSTPLLTAAAAVILLGTACALARGPEEQGPSQGGLPQGVSTTPAQANLGPPTATTPVQPDVTPTSTGQPMGGYAGEGGSRIREDSATRAVRAQLDTVIAATGARVTSMPVPVARGMIAGLGRLLTAQRDPRLQGVIAELELLDVQLAKSPVDGRATGEVLQRLGARASAASPAAGTLAGRVARIGDQLQEAGKRLAP